MKYILLLSLITFSLLFDPTKPLAPGMKIYENNMEDQYILRNKVADVDQKEIWTATYPKNIDNIKVFELHIYYKNDEEQQLSSGLGAKVWPEGDSDGPTIDLSQQPRAPKVQWLRNEKSQKAKDVCDIAGVQIDRAKDFPDNSFGQQKCVTMEMCELCAAQMPTPEVALTDQAAQPMMNIFEQAKGESLWKICSKALWTNQCAKMVNWLFQTGWKSIRLLSGDTNDQHSALKHMNLNMETVQVNDAMPRHLNFTNPSPKSAPVVRSDADFASAWKDDLHTFAQMMLRIITNDYTAVIQDGCAIDLYKRLHANPFIKEFLEPVNEALGVPADFVIPQGNTKPELESANALLSNSVYDIIVKCNKDIKNLDSKSLDTCDGFEEIANVEGHPWMVNRSKFLGQPDM